MSLFSWQCQNLCLLSLAFIIDWKIVYIIHDRGKIPHKSNSLPQSRPKASFHKGWEMGKKLFMHLRVLGFHLLSSLHEVVISLKTYNFKSSKKIILLRCKKGCHLSSFFFKCNDFPGIEKASSSYFITRKITPLVRNP